MNKRNYQRELEEILTEISETSGEQTVSGVSDFTSDKNASCPVLLLHACCGPCSSYVLEYLKKYFHIILFYYNPNIASEDEHRRRFLEVKKLIKEYNETLKGPDIRIVEGKYEPERFYEAVRGLEEEVEGGKRCEACFKLRLEESKKLADEKDADFFATTLTISPLKDAELINAIGEEVCGEGDKMTVRWLPSDFKKKDGYKRSVELSKKYGLYRQDYCGCIYSKMR